MTESRNETAASIRFTSFPVKEAKLMRSYYIRKCLKIQYRTHLGRSDTLGSGREHISNLSPLTDSGVKRNDRVQIV